MIMYGNVSRSGLDSSLGLVWILCLLSLKASGGRTKILYCGLELRKRTKSEEREPVD